MSGYFSGSNRTGQKRRMGTGVNSGGQASILIDSFEEKLGKAFSFTGEDLNANTSGFLTPEQQENLSTLMKSEGCATKSASIAIALTVVVLVAVFLLGADWSSRGFHMALPYYLGTFVFFALIFLISITISRFRRRDIRTGHISVAEGRISTWTKNFEVETALLAAVGGTKFQLHTLEQMQTLQQYSFCRVFYIKHPPLKLILSIQPTG